MALSLDAIESIAPDQASLKAASKLVQSGKWPLLMEEENGTLMWGECQGSGANPYRTVVDKTDLGYKCTCPSRKFPCKHALALMWIRAENVKPFTAGTAPDWVMDWVGRRRKSSGAEKGTVESGGANKSIRAASALEQEKVLDPKAEARKAAAAAKRAETTKTSILAATVELDQWVEDQLRGGLSALLANLTDRCRQIAARLVDGKASGLASRLDEMPSRILAMPEPLRSEGLIAELSKLVLLTHAFRQSPDKVDLRTSVGSGQSRQDLIDNPGAERLSSRWEVLGEQISTRRDGLISQATWLLNLEASQSQRFGLLLDFFPASAGKRSGTATIGSQFNAELVFYPGPLPLRAVIATREADAADRQPWPTSRTEPMAKWQETLGAVPWSLSAPMLLPAGRICEDDGKRHWWVSTEGDNALPLIDRANPLALGTSMRAVAGIWNGWALELICGESDWGRFQFGQ